MGPILQEPRVPVHRNRPIRTFSSFPADLAALSWSINYDFLTLTLTLSRTYPTLTLRGLVSQTLDLTLTPTLT